MRSDDDNAWLLATDAIADHGCDCPTDEDGSCLSCLCDAALLEERAKVDLLTWGVTETEGVTVDNLGEWKAEVIVFDAVAQWNNRVTACGDSPIAALIALRAKTEGG